MLVEPTNTSIVLLNEINKRILENKSVYDQVILMYYLSDKDHSLMRPYIVNNNFYVGLKTRGLAINGLWFLTRSGHCSIEKVERARKRHLE
ncbi:hypothetical protein COOONC_15791 [Cooperia oncophora]